MSYITLQHGVTNDIREKGGIINTTNETQNMSKDYHI